MVSREWTGILNVLMPQLFLAAASSGTYGAAAGITFDRFVRACVVVKTLTESFQRYATSEQTYSQYI